MNRRRFFKTVIGAGVIAAAPASLLALASRPRIKYTVYQPMEILVDPSARDIEHATSMLHRYYEVSIEEVERMYA